MAVPQRRFACLTRAIGLDPVLTPQDSSLLLSGPQPHVVIQWLCQRAKRTESGKSTLSVRKLLYMLLEGDCLALLHFVLRR
jgi:hypothetical protein